MTVTVNSAGAATLYAQPDATFGVDDNGLLEINVDAGTVAIYDEWDSVTTDQFDPTVVTTPPVATPTVVAAPNPAPPEPTPHAEATEVPVEGSPNADASTEPVAPGTPPVGDSGTSPNTPYPTPAPVTTPQFSSDPTSLSQPGGPVLPPSGIPTGPASPPSPA